MNRRISKGIQIVALMTVLAVFYISTIKDLSVVSLLQNLNLNFMPLCKICEEPRLPLDESSWTSQQIELSERIDQHPDDLILRSQRASLFFLQRPDVYTRGNDLACALADMEFVVSRRGNADDWIQLALLQGMANDQRWVYSIRRAKKLGAKIPVLPNKGVMAYVQACLYDGNFRQANIIPWIRSMSELSGDHSLDFYIARIYLQTGKYKQALAEFSRLIRLGGEDSELCYYYLMRGACHKWLGHGELAKADFRSCVKHARAEEEETFKATAMAALGDFSMERCLEGKELSERVLYYLLSDQYQKALSVTVTAKPSNYSDGAFDRFMWADSNSQFDCCVKLSDSKDEQFYLATGLLSPRPIGSLESNYLPGGPVLLSPCFAGEPLSLHLLREMAYKKLNKLQMAEQEHRAAIAFIPANIRRELDVR
ncbi:MAG: hypothetical protein K2X27_02120 [Candidatus Obscuribacterales bacterium]|nr:hypothetical protein [Candidatus Obscuribacterales bacterium]